MRLERIALPLLAAALWTGCTGRADPVGQLTVTPEAVELGYPGIAPLQFAFQFDRPLEGVQGELRVFVHLLDSTGSISRTFDHELPVPWRPGSSHEYTVPLYQSALAPPIPAGSYKVSVGLHDAAGARWPLQTAGERIGADEYAVATVKATENVPHTPMFLFSEVWQPAEGGTDRQILARRWLGGSGSLKLAGVDSPGTLWVTVGIPDAQRSGEELVLDQGATGPAVEVSTECGGFAARIEGVGSHAFPIPIGPGADGTLPAECEIRFQPNFYLVWTLERKTIALESVSWSS
jgi:hypothetical protein